jgi:hypothetical protein
MSWLEMSWLHAIESGWLNVVSLTQGNINSTLGISINRAKRVRHGVIFVGSPAFHDRNYGKAIRA